jgi:hypothetical protein
LWLIIQVFDKWKKKYLQTASSKIYLQNYMIHECTKYIMYLSGTKCDENIPKGSVVLA